MIKDFKNISKHNKETKVPNLNESKLKWLNENGHEVERLNNHQYRINDSIDIYLNPGEFHDLLSGKGGNFNDLTKLVKEYFGGRLWNY